MDRTLEWLCGGIEASHDDRERVRFLHEVWDRLDELGKWQGDTCGTSFRVDAPPMFLHGGHSDRKVVVSGINPGWKANVDTRLDERLRSGREAYVSMHERFFTEYPVFGGGGFRSPFWTNVVGRLTELQGSGHPVDPWSWYGEHIVAQDLIPLRSTRATAPLALFEPGLPLAELAAATLRSFQRSGASLVVMASPEAFRCALVLSTQTGWNAQQTRLAGCTRTGKHVSVDATVIHVPRPATGDLPIVIVANKLFTQPKFPFAEMCCSSVSCSPRKSYAEQLRALV